MTNKDMKHEIQNPKSERGFTLIETLVAVLLLATAITGPLTIASKGLTATLVAKDQFAAFYLAQDAMEFVRYVRDSSCLASGGGPEGCPSDVWLSGLSACVSTDGSASCYVDSIQSTVGSWASCPTTLCVLNYDSDPTRRYFSYTTGTITPQRFIRTVKIQNNPATPDEAIATVEVRWTDVAGVVHAPVVIRENLFRWQ